MSPRLFNLLALGFLTLLPSMAAQAADPPRTQAVEAVRVLRDMVEDAPDKSLPTDMLKNAHAIAVIPKMVTGGFVFSGTKGEGLISIKRDGVWSNPNFISLGGAGVGFLAGIQSADVILVFMTDRGVNEIIDGKWTMGANAGAAAGPVGRSATAATDGRMNAEIYTYARAKGLYAGIALNGAHFSIDDDSNREIYGPGITPRRIFEGGVTNVPSEVVNFRDKLEEYTSR
ncbi:lipid-binding SYLF domain-containing protein [Luteibacter flocculans]|uniref:Lipid-binding SYLF domain-containing protein n=1 Tax=Luteibacter flocculans TaxID=2780091 RepID=A0ABY4T1T2_9GAMM|nr:lipid-binding SYLF domain-containing protein [Luteibacter flocculans]URL58901.1 lipid-binding SYLF domain-containing protein [Luteibacter flocculans]